MHVVSYCMRDIEKPGALLKNRQEGPTFMASFRMKDDTTMRVEHYAYILCGALAAAGIIASWSFKKIFPNIKERNTL